jgi:hypothetical protein
MPSLAVSIVHAATLGPRDLKGVDELCVLAPFRLRNVAPDVRILSLGRDAAIDENSVRALPGLKALRIETLRPVSLAWFARSPIAALAIRDLSVEDEDALERFPLLDVRIDWTRLSLTHLPSSVRSMVLNPLGKVPPRELDALWRLPLLTSADISAATTVSSLGPMKKARALSHLKASLRSLEGIGSIENLSSLSLIGRAPPLQPIASAQQLRVLEIRPDRVPADLRSLGALSRLESLVIDFSGIIRAPSVPSLSFIATMASLEELALRGWIIDDDVIATLADLPKLRRVEMNVQQASRAIAALRQARPDIVIRAAAGSPKVERS